ncbi:hypothetical protein E2C01_091984 [Portunus trituberculatus]|uniref:Uncharacterized protein n=1 Tax=Portunus trituberculatus TaxID=210409 RepID=A0A5B7JPF3_PORTR|nr:hypothetical protein [Portunus trituberculatus]
MNTVMELHEPMNEAHLNKFAIFCTANSNMPYLYKRYRFLSQNLQSPCNAITLDDVKRRVCGKPPTASKYMTYRNVFNALTRLRLMSHEDRDRKEEWDTCRTAAMLV